MNAVIAILLSLSAAWTLAEGLTTGTPNHFRGGYIGGALFGAIALVLSIYAICRASPGRKRTP